MNGCCFELPFTVNSHECDFNGVMKPSGYLKYMQETANVQCERAGFGYDDCLERGSAFILSRVSLDVLIPLRAGAQTVCRTFPADSRGLSFNRSAVLLADDAPAAVLSSVWALVRLSDRSLIRVDESGLILPTCASLETSAPLKLRIPRDTPFTECGVFTVPYSYCDRNRHMNNTRFADMLCDFCPDLSGKTLRELSISYLAEAPLGETLDLFRAPALQDRTETDALFFKATRRFDQKICCEALLSFAAL